MIFKPNSPVADATTRMVIDRFNKALNRHDSDAVAALLTDDTVFEDTSPPPDGQRIEGKAASGDRAVVRWVYNKVRKGQPGICVAWISSRCATVRWRRSSRT